MTDIQVGWISLLLRSKEAMDQSTEQRCCKPRLIQFYISFFFRDGHMQHVMKHLKSSWLWISCFQFISKIRLSRGVETGEVRMPISLQIGIL